MDLEVELEGGTEFASSFIVGLEQVDVELDLLDIILVLFPQEMYTMGRHQSQ